MYWKNVSVKKRFASFKIVFLKRVFFMQSKVFIHYTKSRILSINVPCQKRLYNVHMPSTKTFQVIDMKTLYFHANLLMS